MDTSGLGLLAGASESAAGASDFSVASDPVGFPAVVSGEGLAGGALCGGVLGAGAVFGGVVGCAPVSVPLAGAVPPAAGATAAPPAAASGGQDSDLQDSDLLPPESHLHPVHSQSPWDFAKTPPPLAPVFGLSSASQTLPVSSASIRILPPKPKRLPPPPACPSPASALLHLRADSPHCARIVPTDRGRSRAHSAIPDVPRLAHLPAYSSRERMVHESPGLNRLAELRDSQLIKGTASLAERAGTLGIRASADGRMGADSAFFSAGISDGGTAAPAACGFATKIAPHIPQKRLPSEFSVPHRPQRTYPP